MPGLMDFLRPKTMSDPYMQMSPDVLRAELVRRRAQQGRQIDATQMTPEQMMQMLRTMPVATTGIRG